MMMVCALPEFNFCTSSGIGLGMSMVVRCGSSQVWGVEALTSIV